jgi:LmbE family N-acetylglucosaminyl deacetylase
VISLSPAQGKLDILCLGAHPDDIEIGCGGTLLTLADRPDTSVTGVVLTGEGPRKEEAEAALPRYFPGAAVQVLGLPDGRLPAHWDAAKQALEDVARHHRPDLVLAPRTDDAHQDHRLVGQLVTTVWRDALVLHYEIPKWDGDTGRTTHFVHVSEEDAYRKVELLNKSFPSQVGRDWWDDELYLGLMRVRGVESKSRYAEGFVAGKVVLGLNQTTAQPQDRTTTR